jgi:hypothetical protein
MRSMRYFLTPVLGLFLTAPAWSQITTVGPSTGTQSGEGYSPGTPLYSSPEVSHELRLTQSQIDRLKASTTELRSKYTGQIDRLSRLSGAERVRLLRELERSMSGDWRQAASQILTPEQMKRYTQIELQVRGLEAFSDADIKRKLKLNTGQLQKLQSVRDQAKREMGEVRLLARDDLRKAQRRHEEYRQRWYEAANNILDGDQRRMWREMTGGNFNFKPNLTSPERR